MNATADVVLFVSHSSMDAMLAKVFVEMFEKATKVSARLIRCTSVAGYRLPVGADTEEQLRHEIFVARAFVGILTPSSAQSAYVLFELGARWGAKRHLAPVLARGADPTVLGGPLSGLNALDLADRNQVLQLVQDLVEYLGLSIEPLPSFQEAVDAVVATARAVEVTLPRAPHSSLDDALVTVLQFFASGESTYRPTAAQIEQGTGFSHQKIEYCLEALERKNLIGVVGGTAPTKYWLKYEGREVLFNLDLL